MEEKRAFMRIPTRLTGRLRLLPGPDDMQVYRETPYPGSQGLCPHDAREAGMSEGLFSLLCSINTKLDMLLSMQSRDELSADFPVAVSIVEISGAGIRFTTSTELALEQYVETVIDLSRFPLRMAGAVGRIIRQEVREDGSTEYALDFTRIRERDLESIVQFVFQSQRDDLRGKKWD
ncbi:PilZ domain-containing protein [Solidesulfovibrio sp.]|uniref:PilZ domain-containing protein n=1 Tax=Solidesulfovibrio sp. TaxID=2910990 RepID=UPI002629A36E|nr:PilZ domain-containing protein [Solidesulfovibrio sp.]